MDSINWGTPPVGLFNFPIEAWQRGGRFAERGLDLTLSSHLTGEEYGARIRAGAYDMGQIGTPVFLPAAVGSRRSMTKQELPSLMPLAVPTQWNAARSMSGVEAMLPATRPWARPARTMRLPK